MAASVLIIGPAGRLRDGLYAILRTFPGMGEIIAADDFKLGYELAVTNNPSVIIVDADDSLVEKCVLLKQLLSHHDQTRCLVIANTMHQAAQARQIGADTILTRGFSTTTLYQALVHLELIPESDFVSKPVSLNQERLTAVRLSQKN